MGSDSETEERGVRVDKWLWAARFFKTRALAAEAVRGGRVHLDGERIKPARSVRRGDRLDITRGQERYTVQVEAVSVRRGSAPHAEKLYTETPASVARREAARQQRQDAFLPAADHRPTKRERRQINRLRGR